MMQVLTQRFIECLDLLKELKVIPSLRQFAISLEIHPQCINDIYRGRREVNADIIHKTILKYDLDPNYLFRGVGQPIQEIGVSSLTGDGDSVSEVMTQIRYVPAELYSEYPKYINEEKFINNLPRYIFPETGNATEVRRIFDVTGDAMEPSLFSGEKVICSQLETCVSILKLNYVYILISKNGLYLNRIAAVNKEQLILSSDNGYYDSIEIARKDIIELWIVKNKLSPFMPSPSNIRNALHKEVDGLRMTITDQSKMIGSLNMTVEKLLKQNRQNIIR